MTKRKSESDIDKTYFLGITNFQGENYKVAIELFNEVLSYGNFRNSELYIYLGRSHLALAKPNDIYEASRANETTKSAIDFLSKGIDKGCRAPENYTFLAQAYHNNKQYTKAADTYILAMENSENDFTNLELGNMNIYCSLVYPEKEFHNTAISYYLKELATNPKTDIFSHIENTLNNDPFKIKNILDAIYKELPRSAEFYKSYFNFTTYYFRPENFPQKVDPIALFVLHLDYSYENVMWAVDNSALRLNKEIINEIYPSKVEFDSIADHEMLLRSKTPEVVPVEEINTPKNSTIMKLIHAIGGDYFERKKSYQTEVTGIVTNITASNILNGLPYSQGI